MNTELGSDMLLICTTKKGVRCCCKEDWVLDGGGEPPEQQSTSRLQLEPLGIYEPHQPFIVCLDRTTHGQYNLRVTPLIELDRVIPFSNDYANALISLFRIILAFCRPAGTIPPSLVNFRLSNCQKYGLSSFIDSS